MAASTQHDRMAAPVVLAVALIAHLWTFAVHDSMAMDGHVIVETATASVIDAPLLPATCTMTACTAAPTEEPRQPPALLLSSLAVAVVLCSRPTPDRRRSWSSGDDPGPPLSPVDRGVLLLE